MEEVITPVEKLTQEMIEFKAAHEVLTIDQVLKVFQVQAMRDQTAAVKRGNL